MPLFLENYPTVFYHITFSMLKITTRISPKKSNLLKITTRISPKKSNLTRSPGSIVKLLLSLLCIKEQMLRLGMTALCSQINVAGKFGESAGLFVRRVPLSAFPKTSRNQRGNWVFPKLISSSTSFSAKFSANMDSLPSKVVEHVVFFNVKESTPPEKANAMISALQGLKSLDQVLDLTVGPALRFSSGTYKYTHALHSRYKDKQSLAEYSAHPQHVNVVKEFVLPIIDDLLALDWEADLGEPMMPSYGAIRIAVLKPKEGLADPQRFELVEILSGYKDIFPSVGQVSFGQNFSLARAKGFTWGFLSLFPGVKELEELNTNEEHVKIQNEKVLPQMENFVVIEYITSPNSANL